MARILNVVSLADGHVDRVVDVSDYTDEQVEKAREQLLSEIERTAWHVCETWPDAPAPPPVEPMTEYDARNDADGKTDDESASGAPDATTP